MLRNSAAKLPLRPPATTPRSFQLNVAFRVAHQLVGVDDAARGDTEVVSGRYVGETEAGRMFVRPMAAITQDASTDPGGPTPMTQR